MTYRDELDALRAKNERLGEELAASRAEVERLKHPPRGQRPPWWRRSSRPVVVVATIAVLAGGAVWFLHHGPTRTAQTFWHARVRDARGLPFTPDTACLVRGGLSSDGTSSVSADVRVRCGTQVLYDANSATALACEVGEVPTDASGVYGYWLRCSDPGEADGNGRPALELDTRGGSATLRGLGTRGWSIALDVDGASTERHGAPLFAGNAQQGVPFQRLARQGTVTAATPAAPAASGARCAVDVLPVDGSYNCHVTVRCGGESIYGAGTYGFTHCTVAHDAPVSAHDTKGTADEGDPMLELDLPAHRVVVSDDAPHAYSVTIALDPS